jgi:hypothetical protein
MGFIGFASEDSLDHRLRPRHRRSVKLLQHRLVVPQVHVRGRSGTENLQHLFRLRREVRFAGRSEQLIREQPRKRDAGEAGRHLAEKVAAGEVEG